MRHIGPFVIALLLAGTLVHAQRPKHWTVISIAQTALSGFNSLPAINSKGLVVFLDSTGNTLFVGDEDGINTLYAGGQYSLIGFGGHPDVNAGGRVAFIANRIGGGGVFKGDGDEPTLISSVIGNNVTINRHGDVALSDGNSGIFVGSGEALATIASVDGPLHGFDEATINNKGLVAFHALFDAGGAGIFVGDSGGVRILADSTGALNFDGNFGRHAAINNGSDVAFMAALDSGGRGVFKSSDGNIIPVALAGGPITGFDDDQSVSINQAGDVAFKASTVTGPALFVSEDGITKRVIGVGDAFSEGIVTFLGFGWRGLNDRGQLAFYAALSDGRRMICRAEEH